MGVITSGQIAVKPLRVTTSASLSDIAAAAARSRYPVLSGQPSAGWGSIADDEAPLGLPVSVGINARSATVERENAPMRPARLRLRYYWAALDARVERARPHADWSSVNVLHAADVFLYEEREGSYTGLVSMRTPSPFKAIIAALTELLLSIDDAPQVTTDTLPEVLSEDFFLWLIDVDEQGGDLGDGYVLTDITEISSKDRDFRSARFKDSANAERVELAALIARGRVGFGPAKVTITSELHEATFNIELHLDGGFQPLRSSMYDEIEYATQELGVALVDDAWIDVLPSLRRRYSRDLGGEWGSTRRAALREAALDSICELLRLRRA